MIEFGRSPTIGTVLILDSQEYELTGTRPYIKQDGTTVELLIWLSACPVCDEQFTTESTLKSSGLTRRCPEHRRAGKPVKGKRGRKVKVTMVEA